MILYVKSGKMQDVKMYYCFKGEIQKIGMAENNKCQFMIMVGLLCFLS